MLQVAKVLVNSDFKHNRVENPTKITSRQEKQVKAFVKNFLDKAVAKRALRDQKKVVQAVNGDTTKTPSPSPAVTPVIETIDTIDTIETVKSSYPESDDDGDQAMNLDVSDQDDVHIPDAAANVVAQGASSGCAPSPNMYMSELGK